MCFRGARELVLRSAARLPNRLPVSRCAQRVHAHGASLKLQLELDALETYCLKRRGQTKAQECASVGLPRRSIQLKEGNCCCVS